MRGFFYLWVTKLCFQKPLQIPLLWKAGNFYNGHNIWWNNIWWNNIWCDNIWCDNIWYKRNPFKILVSQYLSDNISIWREFLSICIPPDFFSIFYQKIWKFLKKIDTPRFCFDPNFFSFYIKEIWNFLKKTFDTPNFFFEPQIFFSAFFTKYGFFFDP